jgi:hypothetical protein
MSTRKSPLRALALAALLAPIGLQGCGKDEYNGKDYAQEFEKPAGAPAAAPGAAPGATSDLTPQSRRAE